MSNILFVLYHDFSSNSAVHVHNFANQLAEFGHGVAVAVTKNKAGAIDLGDLRYRPVNYEEVDGRWDVLFPNAQPPDVVHAWTPREGVRLFCERLSGLCAFELFIHLEDNEEVITAANLGASMETLLALEELEVPIGLSHPINYRKFLASAAGVTLIMDRLGDFVPPGIPTLVLWPGADRSIFHPRPPDEKLRDEIGIPINSVVFCYTGNAHSANAAEVRSIYLAVAMLNREGFPTTLVRAGSDFCAFLGSDDRWARQHAVELGPVPHHEIPHLLNLAHVLIQPGSADAFNEFRLPSKLPEFLAMGKPVILPRTNVGRFVTHGEEAWVLEEVSALEIVKNVPGLLCDKALCEKLAVGGIAFCDRHFNWATNAALLDSFYEDISAGPKLSNTENAPI